jgi:hypothetical protein
MLILERLNLMIKRILYLSLFFQSFAICYADKNEIAQTIEYEAFPYDPANVTTEQIEDFIRKHIFPSTLNLSGQFDVTSSLKKINFRHNVISLSLAYCNLEFLPDEIQDFINLFHLDLRGNELKELPLWVSKLSNLKYLDLSDNKLTELPKSFEDLRSLEIINLSNNHFSEPPSILRYCIPIINSSISK